MSKDAIEGWKYRKWLHMDMLDGKLTAKPISGSTGDWVGTVSMMTIYRLADVLELLSKTDSVAIVCPRGALTTSLPDVSKHF